MTKLIKYELRRLALPFGVLYLLSLLLSLSVRITGGGSSFAGILSMLLLCTGTAAVFVFRFWHTTFAAEAVFLYSLPISVWEQLGARALIALVFSFCTAGIQAVSYLLIGDEPGSLIRSLNPLSALVFFAGSALSYVSLILQLELLLTLTGLPPLRSRQKGWAAFFILLSVVIDRMISPVLTRIYPEQFIIAADGEAYLSSTLPGQFSLSFSLAGAPESLILLAVSFLLMVYLTRKHLMILG